MNQPWGMDFISEDKLLITEKVGKLKLLNLSSGEVKDIKGLLRFTLEAKADCLKLKLVQTSKRIKQFFSRTQV